MAVRKVQLFRPDETVEFVEPLPVGPGRLHKLFDGWLTKLVPSEVSGSAAALATRACLYQTITRAQLMALVVNEYVSGGWLEHLALCKLMAGEFDESAGRIESSTGAAAQVVKEIQAKSHQGKFEEGKEGGLFKGTATQTLKTHGAPAQISTAPLPSASETVAGKKEMQSRASVVWDTGHNSIKTPIYELSFDPSRRSTAEAFEMLRKILPGEQLMAVPSTCPYPKKDCLIWQYNHHDSSVVELIIENTSYTEHAFLFCRDGSCLRRYKRYSKKTDAHHDGSELHIFDPEEEWIGSVGEGQFKLEGCTLSGTLRQAKGFAEWRTSDFWSQGRDIDFHYTRKELLSHRLSKREAYLEEKFAELSENKLKDLGMDPQHLWFWQADL